MTEKIVKEGGREGREGGRERKKDQNPGDTK